VKINREYYPTEDLLDFSVVRRSGWDWGQALVEAAVEHWPRDRLRLEASVAEVGLGPGHPGVR
jgi:hypothetical protein